MRIPKINGRKIIIRIFFITNKKSILTTAPIKKYKYSGVKNAAKIRLNIEILIAAGRLPFVIPVYAIVILPVGRRAININPNASNGESGKKIFPKKNAKNGRKIKFKTSDVSFNAVFGFVNTVETFKLTICGKIIKNVSGKMRICKNFASTLLPNIIPKIIDTTIIYTKFF